jgi:hypothetical protein
MEEIEHVLARCMIDVGHDTEFKIRRISAHESMESIKKINPKKKYLGLMIIRSIR